MPDQSTSQSTRARAKKQAYPEIRKKPIRWLGSVKNANHRQALIKIRSLTKKSGSVRWSVSEQRTHDVRWVQGFQKTRDRKRIAFYGSYPAASALKTLKREYSTLLNEYVSICL